MIRIVPPGPSSSECPRCGAVLQRTDWYIPGMRTLAECSCAHCGGDFYCDLPSGHGLMSPVVLDARTGEVHHNDALAIFAEQLRNAYAARVEVSPVMEVEALRPVRRPVVLNCLDWVYGHSLLKLLNAQYYIDHQADFDLIVLVPRYLRWMVPYGAAEIWTVDLPLSRGAEWNDGLARDIRAKLADFPEVFLAVSLSHPHPADFDIERFTRVPPMRIEGWAAEPFRPTVTFIWRPDRPWTKRGSGLGERLERRIRTQLLGGAVDQDEARRVEELASAVRRRMPDVDFAVVGMGQGGRLAGWIGDLRTARIDATVERSWCERYARSHVVVGVHGSNLLLPSAHAGAVVEMVPDFAWDSRWGNVIQDLLVATDDVREALFRYRLLPLDTTVEDVASIVASIVRYLPLARLNYRREWTDHGHPPDQWSEMARHYADADRFSKRSAPPRSLAESSAERAVTE